MRPWAEGRSRRGIDEATLQHVADLTGGIYCPAESASDLQGIVGEPTATLVGRTSR